MRRAKRRATCLGVAPALTLAFLSAAPVRAAGFAIFEQGAKAMGMAGAFTAQADDGSAMFHNVGGLALLEERGFYAGGSLISLGASEFDGLVPFPGPTQTGDQANALLFAPHFYWTEPLNDAWRFGLAVNAPFGLATEWADPDDWSGRFISEKAVLEAIDVSANAGWRPRDDLGVGFGVVVRASSVELRRRSAALNPFTSMQEEVAKVRLESDVEAGVGFSVGLLQRVGDRLSWGITYRSKLEIDYSGDARLTQQPTGDAMFDAIVAASSPFDQDLPIETSVEFPDQAFVGVACEVVRDWLVEADLLWHGWSTFDVLEIRFPGGELPDEIRPQNWGDAWAYRFGARWDVSERSQWRFGYYHDESPQPDDSVGPLLPDADRNGFSVGYGLKGQRLQSDFYLLYVAFNERTTTTNLDGFNGTYDSSVWLGGASFGW